MKILSKQVTRAEQKTKRIKVCEFPPTWIEVPADIPDAKAISQFIKKQNRSDDLLDRKIFELRYARTNI